MVALVANSPASVIRDTPGALPDPRHPSWRMTTNTLHSPLEELLFFNSLQSHGVNQSSFAKVSATLQDNEYIRSDPSYDAERLNPSNLQQLYLKLLKEEVRIAIRGVAAPDTEGDTNKRKRKQSTPPLQSLEEASQHNHLLPQLVERLYARYQEHAVNEIRAKEARYDQLKKEIGEIERGEWDDRLDEAVKQQTRNGSASGSIDGNEKTDALLIASDALLQAPNEFIPVSSPAPLPSSGLQDKGEGVGDAGAQTLAASHEAAEAQARAHSQAQSPVAQHAFQQMPPPHPHAQTLGIHGQTPLGQRERSSASPATHPPSTLRSSASPHRQMEDFAERKSQARSAAGTPLPHGQRLAQPQPPQTVPQAGAYGQKPPPYYGQPQPYPVYPPYQQQQMARFQSPTQTPQSQGYPIPPYPMYPQNARPNQPPYQGQATSLSGLQGPHPGYMGYQSPQATPYSQFHQTHIQTPASTASRRQGLTPINTSAASTRWKSSPGKVAKDGNKSPTAPPLSPFLPSSPDISPIDETESPLPPRSKRETGSRESTNTLARGNRSGRGGRWAGHIARGRGGRAESQLTPRTPMGTSTPDHATGSPAKEPTPDVSQARKLKGEPSTPAPATTEDTSAISTPASTNRPMRNRRDTFRQSVDLSRPQLKRKRANTVEGPGTPEGTPAQLVLQPTRPGYVLASRNFPRVVNPLMHEINSHKLASMFAKPITEKDAPGYRSIIYQAQDLKSIRAAISAGSRAVVAAEKEATADDVGSPAVATPTAAGGAATGTPSGAGGSSSSSKGGTVWVERTPDVVPPKGIVNGTQLEKEICRMFANAVMFNLDPQRGFGAALRKSADDSDVEDDDDDAEKGYEIDDGGAFVRDAREMFEGVEKSVHAWRSVERVGAEGVRPRGGGGMEESEGDEAMADG